MAHRRRVTHFAADQESTPLRCAAAIAVSLGILAAVAWGVHGTVSPERKPDAARESAAQADPTRAASGRHEGARPLGDLPTAPSKTPPPPIDSAQMLERRTFSDGYVSPNALPAVPRDSAQPSAQQRAEAASRIYQSGSHNTDIQRNTMTAPSWKYVHSSSCTGLQSRRQTIGQRLKTDAGTLPDWRTQQLREEHAENLQRERLGLCR
jgi:hypothetical protein